MLSNKEYKDANNEKNCENDYDVKTKIPYRK